jgi:hypothetical protein
MGKSCYCSNRERICRLEDRIKREASQGRDDRKIKRRVRLSGMAQQAFSSAPTTMQAIPHTIHVWGCGGRFCTCWESYSDVPLPKMMLKNCSTPVCHLLIMSTLCVVGRYVLNDEIHKLLYLSWRRRITDWRMNKRGLWLFSTQRCNKWRTTFRMKAVSLHRLRTALRQPHELRVGMFMNATVVMGIRCTRRIVGSLCLLLLLEWSTRRKLYVYTSWIGFQHYFSMRTLWIQQRQWGSSYLHYS